MPAKIVSILTLLLCGILPVSAQEGLLSFRSPNFEIKYQKGVSEEDARKVAEYVEKDYAYLSSLLRLNLKARVEVRLYDTDLKFTKGAGARTATPGVSLNRGIIHVKPVARLEAENRLAQSLSMELAEALLEGAVRLGCPQWLAQSFAVYHAGLMPDITPPPRKKLRIFSDLDVHHHEYPHPP